MGLGMRPAFFWMVISLLLFKSIKPSNSIFMPPTEVESIGFAKVFDGKYEYKRNKDVKTKCASYFQSASQLNYDDTSKTSLMYEELSYYNGNWKYDTGGQKPLVPMPNYDVGVHPFRLSSLSLQNLEKNEESSAILKVAGYISIWITNGSYYGGNTYYIGSPNPSYSSSFVFTPFYSSLNIEFEGIYTEPNDGGERVVCLLGKTDIPLRTRNSSDTWEKTQNEWTNKFEVFQDDQILIILHYPRSFSLMSRVIYGDIKSLRDKTDPHYFDKIEVSSQLRNYANYKFGSDKLISRACSPSAYQGKLLPDRLKTWKARRSCRSASHFLSGTSVIVPNWKCNSTENYCNKLGPFNSSQVVRGGDGMGVEFQNIMLSVQDVVCEANSGQPYRSSNRAAAVFRAVHPIEIQIGESTSLDSMTLVAEGNWSSDGSHLCTVGCLGPNDTKCDTRISIYLPTSFSISQRNIAVGSISNATANEPPSYYPLSFEKRLISRWDLQSIGYLISNISYRYTKLDKASAFLKKNDDIDFKSITKKSILRYPHLEDGDDAYFGYLNLAEDLGGIAYNSLTSTRANMELFTIGSSFLHISSTNISWTERNRQSNPKVTIEESLLNVSATLRLFDDRGIRFDNISELFLEGIYNPISGMMYLIGCRDVHAPWKVLSQSSGLDNGLDCLIKVKLEYPPVTMSWSVSQSVKILISSERKDDDPLHFHDVDLTCPIMYRRQREDILSRRNVEGFLQILTLSLTTASILSQLFFIRKDPSSIPYISIVMLGILVISYGIPLISGAEALLFGRKSKSNVTPTTYLEKNQSSNLASYFVKSLFLVALLSTVRLLQKVWKSRARLLSRVPVEQRGSVPSDKWVLLVSLCIHVLGFFVEVGVNSIPHHQSALKDYEVMNATIHNPRGWGIELEEYVGLVQDFFLLPQVIGSFLWQLDGKPLRKTFYIGIAALRVLPHVYDFAMVPIPDPYFQGGPEYIEPNRDFYSKFGDIAIPFVAILLAVIVYCQQKWNFQKLCQLLGLDRIKILSLRPKVYQKLPTVNEAELVGIRRDVERSWSGEEQ